MLSVTYRQLSQADSYTLEKLQGFTGNLVAYGMNTPIAILDIINHVSLDLGISCLTYVPDSQAIQNLVALAMVRSYSSIWNEVKPGDIYFSALLDLLDMATQMSGEPEVRKDYCDNVIPGFDGTVSHAQVEDYLLAMQNYVDAMSNTGTYTTYTYWMTGGGEWDQAAIDFQNNLGVGRWRLLTQDVNKTDPVILMSLYGVTDPGDYPNYIAAKYKNKLQPEVKPEEFDIEWFLRQSLVYDAIPVHNYTTYGVIVHQKMVDIGSNQTVFENWTKIAAQQIIDVATLLSNMILYSTDSLDGILGLLLSTSTIHADSRRMEIQAIIARLNDMKNGVFPFYTYSSPTVTAIERVVIDAGETARRSVLQNYNYVGTWSSDNETISESDRKRMELDVRLRMLAARKTAAQAYYDSYRAEYGSLSSGLSLVDIITPYLL